MVNCDICARNAAAAAFVIMVNGELYVKSAVAAAFVNMA
jgi:hypothetical protein